MLVNQPLSMANKVIPNHITTANLIEEQIMKIAFEIENEVSSTYRV